MKLTTPGGERIVFAAPLRTPIGQAGKSLSRTLPHKLAVELIGQLFERYAIDATKQQLIDSVVAGQIGQDSRAPNIARVVSVELGLPLAATAVTVANNCVSGYEAITAAARRLMIGEATTALVFGVESMSQYFLYLDKARDNPKTATIEKLRKNWAEALELGVEPVDSLEEGLTDPVRQMNMAMTGEIAAQNYRLSRKELDQYAHRSYSKSYEAITAGRYAPYIAPIQGEKGLLEHDEYIMSKLGMVEKPDRFDRATAIFDSAYMRLDEFYARYQAYIRHPYDAATAEPGVTLFNACPRSDGAAALIVTTESGAERLGLEIAAYLDSWGMTGVDPAHMGIGMAPSMALALKRAGRSFGDVGGFELHEAFAATAIGTMYAVKEEYGFDLVAADNDGRVNPNGGTLALGHPLGATGIRIAINQIMHLKEKGVGEVLGAVCAGGGVGGALLLSAG